MTQACHQSLLATEEKAIINTKQTRSKKNAGILCGLLFVVLLAVQSAPSFGQSAIYEQRNSIEAGDGSVNLIATTGAEIVFILNDDGTSTALTKPEFLDEILIDENSALAEAEQALPGQPMNVVEDLTIAKHLFSVGQYSSSAAIYQRVLGAIGPENPQYLEIQGMTTASLYGSSRHLEGLVFICQQYKALPTDDVRFRHAIHAHLRSLAVNLGHDQARRILEFVRESSDCNRPDMSPIWIPIHLHDMRDLEKNVAPIGGLYGIRDEQDREFADAVLREEGHGFKDYLYFVMRDYETVITEYPNSLVYNLALLGAGELSNYADAAGYLQEYIDEHSRHRNLALHTLYLRMVNAGDFTSVAALLENYSDTNIVSPETEGAVSFQVDGNTRVWVNGGKISGLTLEQAGLIGEFYTECRTLEALLQTPRGFPYVVEKLGVYGERFEALFVEEIELQGWFGQRHDLEYNEQCAFELRGRPFVEFSEIFADARDTLLGDDEDEIRRIAQEFKNCGDYRQGYRKGPLQGLTQAPYSFCVKVDEICNDMGEFFPCDAIPLQDLSAALLEMTYRMSSLQSSDDLFLSALAHRNSHNYLEYALALEQYVSFYPDKHFADDALTELGWYYMEVSQDLPRSEEYFLRVVEGYEFTNAYDNALNWLVILKFRTRDFHAAAYWSSLLAANVTSTRIREFAGSRHEAIDEISSQYVAVESTELFVTDTGSSSEIYCSHLRINDNAIHNTVSVNELGYGICRIDNQEVKSATEFYRRIAQVSLQSEQTVKVEFAFNRTSDASILLNLPVSAFGFDN